MVVKREYSESGSGSEFENEEEDIKPVITPKKSKSTKTIQPSSSSTKSSSSKSNNHDQSESGSPTKKSKLDNEAKRMIAEKTIVVGIKGIDIDSLARATGLTVQQVRSQVAGGGRANLRKQLMDLAMAL